MSASPLARKNSALPLTNLEYTCCFCADSRVSAHMCVSVCACSRALPWLVRLGNTSSSTIATQPSSCAFRQPTAMARVRCFVQLLGSFFLPPSRFGYQNSTATASGLAKSLPTMSALERFTISSPAHVFTVAPTATTASWAPVCSTVAICLYSTLGIVRGLR